MDPGPLNPIRSLPRKGDVQPVGDIDYRMPKRRLSVEEMTPQQRRETELSLKRRAWPPFRHRTFYR